MFDKELGIDIRNTASMDMRLQSPDDYSSLDDLADRPVQVVTIFSGEAFLKLVNYPVIVEGWSKQKHGRVKREWLRQFSQAERNTIGRYHGRFYRWHMISGVPQHVSCKPRTLELLRRAVDFFANI